MARQPRATSLWFVLLALGGLLAGHIASYFVVAPHAHERAELLAVTGHSGQGLFATLALAASFAALIGVFAQRLRDRRDRGLLAASRPRLAVLLWAAQTVGFAALETWERGHGPAGLAELLHEPAFLVGLVAQLAVALVATAIVLLVRATAAALLRLLVPVVAAPVAPPFFDGSHLGPRVSVARAAWNLRGPPSPAPSTS